MKFRTPNPKIEDELAMEMLKRMEEEDTLPRLRYTESQYQERKGDSSNLEVQRLWEAIYELQQELKQIKQRIEDII